MSRYRKVRNASGQMGWSKLAAFSHSIVVPFTGQADGLTSSASITTDPGLPFVLTEIRCLTDGDGATLTNLQQLLISITDGANQSLMSNVPIPREHMCGTRDFPRQLPSEVEIVPSDTITATVTNKTGGALTTNVRITLTGYKLMGWSVGKPEE
jgi:hypothetical protein